MSGTRPARTAELLAPAGEPRALRAALAAGADAVYFGLDRYSARAFAGNFAGDAAPAAIDLAHSYGARAYLALNTLLKDAEVGPALAALEGPYMAGLDALIVADLGLIGRVRDQFPGLDLHASTQLNTHSSAQLAALARLGCRRAVLARELSLREIATLDTHGLEIEVFTHGALCYGYSGNCLLSSMIGGRSGNRGRCSQACRLRYELRGAGAGASGATAGARIMSTSDLSALDMLPQLLAAGVTSFKLEGRMKDAAYVATTTAVYREALTAALADPAGYAVRPEWRARLEQSFSRSFTTAHLEGRHHEVRGGRSGHRGVLVGRVARVDEASGQVEVRLSQPVSAGDVVCFYTPWGQTEPLRLEDGGEQLLRLRLRERVAVKDRLFRIAAAEADERAQDLISGREVLRSVMLQMRLAGGEGEPAQLTVALAAEPALAVSVSSAVLLSPARTAALGEAKARDALGALGGTPYRLAALDFALADGLFLPVGELKELRRRAVAELDERRLARHRRARPPFGPVQARVAASRLPLSAGSPRATDALCVVLRLRPGERPLLAPGITALCLDLLPDDPLAQVAAAAQELRTSGLPLRLRLPEVLFDADEQWWRALLGLSWQAVYARHLGLLAGLGPGFPPFILEAPVQGLNSLAAGVAAELAGSWPAAVLVSPESSLAEIAALSPGGAALEILAFGRQQLLHTRDQLGRAEGLYPPPASGGHVPLSLTDAKGYEFPVTIDTGGSRLFNARVTNLAANQDQLREAGVSGFVVVQSDLNMVERDAFGRGGLTALAPLAARERSTTGHLFRGVA